MCKYTGTSQFILTAIANTKGGKREGGRKKDWKIGHQRGKGGWGKGGALFSTVEIPGPEGGRGETKGEGGKRSTPVRLYRSLEKSYGRERKASRRASKTARGT